MLHCTKLYHHTYLLYMWVSCIPQCSYAPWHEVHSQLSSQVPTVKHPWTPSTLFGTHGTLCHHLQQTQEHKHWLYYQPAWMTCIPQQSHVPWYKVLSQLSPQVPTVKHPSSTLPCTLNAFHNLLQQAPMHIHSFSTAFPYTKHILLLY